MRSGWQSSISGWPAIARCSPGSNEARLIDQIDAHLGKVIELGFLRRLKVGPGQPTMVEVRRILKAFVDAQWLAEFDQRLAGYRALLAGQQGVVDE